MSNASGTQGLAASVATGTTTVTASSGSVSATTTLTVTSAVLVSIAVTPETPSIALGTTQQFAAIGTFTDGSTQDLTSTATWSSDTLSVAGVRKTGLSASTGLGTATISASSDPVSASTVLTVTAAELVSIAINPPGATIPLGSTQPFTATGTYTDATTQDLTQSGHWSSTELTVATISDSAPTQGLTTTIGTGTTMIGINSASVAAYVPLTITPAALVSITISPQTPSVALGNAQQFIATGTYTDGVTRDITSVVTWGVSPGSVAVVSNTTGTNGLATSAGVGSTAVSATSGLISGSTSLTVGEAMLVSISIAPQSVSVFLGGAQQFIVTGTFTDGSTRDLTGSVIWSSDTPAVAPIASGGLATAAGLGVANITAASGTISTSTALAVVVPTLLSIAISPPGASIAKGTMQQFSAAGAYSDGSTADLTSSVLWASSLSAIANVTTGGLADGKGAGNTTITARLGPITSSVTLSVGAAALLSIAISPANASLALGTTEGLKATGTYTDGSTMDVTASVAWGIADSSVAEVDAAGMAHSVAVGSTRVTATSGAVAGATTLNVTAAELISIAVTPAVPTIPLGTTQQFTATGTFTDNSTQNITQTVEWSTDNPNTASMSNASGTQGLAASVATGTTTVTASSGSVSATTTLTVTSAVLAMIAVTPVDPSIALGTNQQFTAAGTFTDGTTQNLTSTATWTSDTPSIATVSNAGLATSLGAGRATLSASSGALTGSTVLTVTAAQVVSIAINPQTGAVPLGATQQFTANATYTDETTQDITQTGHWSSSNAVVATISDSPGSQGLASTLTLGTTTISIASGSVTASATLTATAAVLASIIINPASATIQLSGSQQFTATGVYTDGSTIDLTSLVNWNSSSSSVAVVGNTPETAGLATSAGPGGTTVTATIGSIYSAASLTVAEPIAITITPSSANFTIGFTQQFRAIANYGDGTTQDVTSTAIWTSSNPAIATIGLLGLATSGISPGSTTINASYGGVKGSSTLTVSVGAQYTHIYVVFPPASGVNNTHLMNTVINQPAIDGVSVQVTWSAIEVSRPGPNSCSPVGTDTCQQDSLGWTHSYNWISTDAANAQWFAAQGGTKKVNILLFGMTPPSSACLQSNSCTNTGTPYYATTPSWIGHTGATVQNVVNAVKDGCTNWYGKTAKSMSRNSAGLVTVAESNHGYNNGDIIWTGGTTPSDYNIAQAKISSVQVSNSTLTITANNSYPAGMAVAFGSLGKATFLNGQTVTVTTSTATAFTATFAHSNYGPTSEINGVATPGGVVVQNATSGSFQYQSGTHTANSATVSGQTISLPQSWFVPYEPGYKEAWKPFVAAALLHYANNPQVGYMRVGRSAGAEAFPYCPAAMKTLPNPNTYSETVWLNYYTEIEDFVQAQNPTMQILDPLNAAETPSNYTYSSAEASFAVVHTNALGAPNGVGNQGLQASDITNYNGGQHCSSDWCGIFGSYYQMIYPLELQQADLSNPTGATNVSSATGDLRPLLPFAAQRHATILELYYLDSLLAYDQDYCVLTVPDSGMCAAGSVSIPSINLPPSDQYPYFQAVGQPGRAGATGDASYATAINTAHGPH
jgi:hypothetical protein